MVNILLSNDLPTFSNGVHYDHYPYERLDSGALAAFSAAASSEAQNFLVQRTAKAFECYLQLTDQQLVSRPSTELKLMAEGFIGFLYSSNHVEASQSARLERARLFIDAFPRLHHSHEKLEIDFCLKKNTIPNYVQEFESFKINEELVEYWRGWPIVNVSGGRSYLPLWGFWRKIGPEYTRKLYTVTHLFLYGRRYRGMPCLLEFGEFLETQATPIDPSHLNSDTYMASFWERFAKHYVFTKYKNGQGRKLSTIAMSWNVSFRYFAYQILAPAGLISTGYAGFPKLPKKLYRNAKTRISSTSNGTLVHTKLIHDIPLEVTDEEAIYDIFDRLQHSMTCLEKWSRAEISNLEARYNRRKIEALNGQTRWINEVGTNQYSRGGYEWRLNRENPEYFAHAAANLEFHSYRYLMDKKTQLFPQPLGDTAYELGLATSGSLYPHCVMLTILHPKITPGFLFEFEIFDSSGKPIGFIQTDAGYELVGYKFRNGRREAEQVIHLTEYSTYIIQQIISVTQYGREDLRLAGDDNYRYLLLSAVRSFGKFQRPKLSSCTGSPKMLEAIVNGLKNHANLCELDATTLAKRANLSTIRATAGVLVYLKSKSAEKMAEALGHKKFDPVLLGRYLPAPIWDFFQDRWIRIFQAGIILEAMQDSDYRLPASGFETLDQVEQFLLNHSIKLPPEPVEGSERPTSCSETLLIGLNETIFTELLKLKNDNYRTGSLIKKNLWSQFSSKIIDYVNSNLSDRPDIQSALFSARGEMEYPV